MVHRTKRTLIKSEEKDAVWNYSSITKEIKLTTTKMWNNLFSDGWGTSFSLKFQLSGLELILKDV